MDLAPIQPTYLPLNCSFYVGDIIFDLDDDAMFPTGSIDLVQMRCGSFFPYPADDIRQVHAGMKTEDWPNVINNIYRMLKPGTGWAQIGECNGIVVDPSVQPPSSSALWQVCHYPEAR
jgi:hypothetical protein